jgi:hypothetical protein
VFNVVGRFRDGRNKQGGNADTDGLDELLGHVRGSERSGAVRDGDVEQAAHVDQGRRAPEG